MKIFAFLLALAIPLPLSGARASTPPLEPTCDGEDYATRSKELKKICDDDQAERADFAHADEARLIEMLKHDRVRRARVAEIFAKGCLKSAEDYLNAATVFQHGEVPDHFYQTYIWAKKAFDQGLEAAGAEPGKGPVDQACFCLWPIEPSFPNRLRSALKFRTRRQIQDWLRDMNKDRKGCSNGFCAKVDAKPVVRGSVPGVW